MTFVGKILVIIIMVFALFFLALSTVVFTTATNWKEETKKQKDQVKKLQDQVSTAKAEAASLTKQLADDQGAHKAATDLLKGQIASLEGQNKQRQDEITEVRR